MPFSIFLNFVQRFSFLQQYLIILSICLIFLVINNYVWCIFLLPLSTIIAYFIIKSLSRGTQKAIVFPGDLYEFYLRKRTIKSVDNEINALQTNKSSLEHEFDIYVRMIVALYISVWYYPHISTDQEFLDDLKGLFPMILNRVNDRLKSLNVYELIRRIIKLKQNHIEQYLQTLDSYKKQCRSNRISKNLVEEFSNRVGFHQCLIKNDIHTYLRAIVELLLTDLLPESFQFYSGSRAGRELLTQMLTNTIFLPLFHKFSQPKTIFFLIVTLWESDEEKKFYENQEHQTTISSNENECNSIEKETEKSNEEFQHLNENQENQRRKFEQIIYSATIISADRSYDENSGAAYTDYIIQVNFVSIATKNEMLRNLVQNKISVCLRYRSRLYNSTTFSRIF